jgi:integrase/recombinase XerD
MLRPDLEARGKARATAARRLCTIVGFYRYAEEEGVIADSPVVRIRRPRIDHESRVAHLDRNELGPILSPPACPHRATTPWFRCWR